MEFEGRIGIHMVEIDGGKVVGVRPLQKNADLLQNDCEKNTRGRFLTLPSGKQPLWG